MVRDMLRQDGVFSGRRHVATLMRRMGIEALYRKPTTSRKHPGHAVHPYLLRGLAVTRPNQVWTMDITGPHKMLAFCGNPSRTSPWRGASCILPP